jgi:hypothetical protein
MFDFQSYELEFGLIFAIVGAVLFCVLVFKPATNQSSNRPFYIRLWEFCMGCLAAGAALIWAGVR